MDESVVCIIGGVFVVFWVVVEVEDWF